MPQVLQPPSTTHTKPPRASSGGSDIGLPPIEDPSPDRDRPSFRDFVPFDFKITGLTAEAIESLGGKLPKYITPEVAFSLNQKQREQTALALQVTADADVDLSPDDLKVEVHIPAHLSPRLSSILAEPDRERLARYIIDVCNNAFGRAPAISYTGYANILPNLPSKTEVRVADGALLHLPDSQRKLLDLRKMGFLIWHANETPRELHASI